MKDSTPRVIGEGTLVDIIKEEITTYKPQSVELGLSANVFRERNNYFRDYAIHFQVKVGDRNLSGRLRTTKRTSVDEIFENLRSLLQPTYNMTDTISNRSNESMKYRYIVLKADSSILREDVNADDDS